MRAATDVVRGGGASSSTSGVQNMDAQVHVEVDSDNRMNLSITSGQRLIELRR